MATSVIQNHIIETDGIPVTLLSGGTADCPHTIRYYRSGGIVILSCAFWSFAIQNPTSNYMMIKLPYANIGTRIIGNFGYNNSGKNYIPVISSRDGLSFCVKAATGNTTDVKESDWSSFIGQFSIVYPTDGVRL